MYKKTRCPNSKALVHKYQLCKTIFFSLLLSYGFIVLCASACIRVELCAYACVLYKPTSEIENPVLSDWNTISHSVLSAERFYWIKSSSSYQHLQQRRNSFKLNLNLSGFEWNVLIFASNLRRQFWICIKCDSSTLNEERAICYDFYQFPTLS